MLGLQPYRIFNHNLLILGLLYVALDDIQLCRPDGCDCIMCHKIDGYKRGCKFIFKASASGSHSCAQGTHIDGERIGATVPKLVTLILRKPTANRCKERANAIVVRATHIVVRATHIDDATLPQPMHPMQSPHHCGSSYSIIGTVSSLDGWQVNKLLIEAI